MEDTTKGKKKRDNGEEIEENGEKGEEGGKWRSERME
jgi:hypothetical protein